MISNNVIFGQAKAPRFEEDTEHIKCICFAQPFYEGWYNKNKPFTWAAYRIDELSPQRAEWFFTNVVLPSIPDRVAPFVEFHDYNAIAYEKLRIHDEEEWLPWKMMFLHDDGLYAEDAYILLATMRVPQENPSIVHRAFELMAVFATEQITPMEAYSLACFQTDGNRGHLLLTAMSLTAADWETGLSRFTLKNLWETTPLVAKKWVENKSQKLSTVNSTWIQKPDNDPKGWGGSAGKCLTDKELPKALAALRKVA